MTTTPNMSLVLPTDHSDTDLWGAILNTLFGLVDSHDHSTGKGVKIPSAALNINADVSWSAGGTSRSITDLVALDFKPSPSTAVTSLAGALFISDGTGGLTANELYFRTTSGTNVRFTNGTALNVAGFAGGIGGDYSAVGAAVAFDDANDRYTFKQQANVWARMASGEVRILETGTSESLFVGIAAPAALAGSYSITLPLAAPGSTSIVQMDSAGVLTATNTMASNQSITLSGTGEVKHGDRVKVIMGCSGSCIGGSGILTYGSAGDLGSTGATTFTFPLELLQGDRIKSVTFARQGDGAVDVTGALVETVAAASGSSVSDISSGGITITNVGAAWADSTIDCTDTTLTAGLAAVLVIVVNAANFRINNIRVTYDRP